MQAMEFESWWRAADERLRTFLPSRRVHRDDVDDLIQRIALRAIAQPPFENERHLVAWSVVVAKNLMVDDGRRRARNANALRLLHASQSRDVSVEELAIGRIKEQNLHAVIAELPDEKRALLFALSADDGGETKPTVTRVAKHRVRKDLRSIYDRLGVAILSWRLALRRWWGAIDANGWEAPAAAALALAVLGAGALGVLGIRSPEPPGPPQQSARRPSADWFPLRPALTTEVVTHPSDQDPGRDATERRQQPVLKVGLGPDAQGRERGAQVRDRLPEETDAAVCLGDPGASDQWCVAWPSPVLAVGAVITALLATADG